MDIISEDIGSEDILNDIKLLRAHANAALELADKLSKKLQPVSTGSSKKNVLSNEAKANLLVRKHRTVAPNYVTTKS